MTDYFDVEFSQQAIERMKNYKYGQNWPVVYIIHGEKEAYIGETTSVVRRTKDHLKDPDRDRLEAIKVIADDQFNKSATLDIESKLIEFMAADQKYVLQNSNRGLRKHDYYQKDIYHDKFSEIWDLLKEEKLAINDIFDIENSDLFKYSPFKVLTEEQLEIVQSIEKIMQLEDESNHVVKGEPGSGKTILAVYLVKYLLEDKTNGFNNIGLVVPMTSLRGTIKRIFKNIKGLQAKMVIGPYDVAKRKYDLLIVDESHRLARRKQLSNYRAFDNVNKKLGFDKEEGTQLDWIFKQGKHVVLFYDKNQSVKPTDIQSDEFSSINANKYSLESQFRVKAGKKYTEYIENILNQENQFKIEFSNYDLKLYKDVQDMVNRIKEKNSEVELSRVVAGYAWKWESKKDKSKYDIFIKDYKYKWNSVNKDWINSLNAINEIGCIHTVQGYDLNYAGVIIGLELYMEDGVIKYNGDHYKDTIAKDLTLSDDEMKEYIINIYKTLLTRGIYGTYVYICDDELRDYFSKYIEYPNKKENYYSINSNNHGKVAED